MEFPISGALDIIYQITIMQRKQGSVDSIFRPSNNEFLNCLGQLIENTIYFFLLHKSFSARQRDQKHPNEAAIFRMAVICHR